ncbi:MAG: endonuclease/exonuclease/phosphatase family protein [Clostridia bacterium]|nr:endonuclease/exonuclease/phosphatase family protein [Clostridia bacterium]
MKLRLMSFNTQHFLGYMTRKIDFKASAKLISDLGADIVGLQEIRSRGTDVNEYDDQTARMCELTGFYGYFAEAIKFGGTEPYGNALLSRYPIKSAQTVMIPDPAVRGYKGYYETRCVLKAEIDVPGGLTVLVTHFGLNPDEQENAVKTVTGLIGNERTVLMGDFNVLPGDPILLPIREKLYDTAESFPSWESGMSFPSDRPDRKIDYIFTSKDIKVLKAEIPAASVSDHRPYTADAEI